MLLFLTSRASKQQEKPGKDTLLAGKYYLYYASKKDDLKELCHETAHARELRVNLKRLAQLFQVSRGDRDSEFIALNLGHPRIFFVFGGFLM